MAYEFTKQKLAAERKALAKRLVLAGVAGSVGLALGVSIYDMGSIWGIVSASVLASFAGLGTFYLVGYPGRWAHDPQETEVSAGKAEFFARGDSGHTLKVGTTRDGKTDLQRLK